MLRYQHGGDIFSHKTIALDYSTNLNPLGMPAPVKDALLAHPEDFSRYPDPYCRRLRQDLAAYEDIAEDFILCGNGASELIFRLCLTVKPQKALVCAPTFSEYEKAVLQAGGQPVYHMLHEEEGFQLTSRILRQLTPDLDMLFLCNPNNPTGRLADFGLLDRIAWECRANQILLIVDECFLDFTGGRSLKPLLGSHCQLVILKAFTKIYAMAGLRLGYLLSANTQLLRQTGDCGQSWSVSGPAQIAGSAACACRGWIEEGRLLTEQERQYLSQELQALGLRVFPSDANFLLFQGPAPLYERMLERGVLLRPCRNFPGLKAGYFRAAVKTRPENQQLIAVLKEALKDE
jgi:threonine-phosphate decarboxylase